MMNHKLSNPIENSEEGGARDESVDNTKMMYLVKMFPLEIKINRTERFSILLTGLEIKG